MSVKDGWSPADLMPYLNLAIPDLPMEMKEKVVARYAEAWRTYHNYCHILWMIKTAEQLFKSKLTAREWRLLLIIIIYHDIVYYVGKPAGYNERESAEYAIDDMFYAEDLYEDEDIVWDAIVATTKHNLDEVPESYAWLVSIVLDLDLMTLGADWSVFSDNTERLWSEQKQTHTLEEFTVNSARWATSLLTRPFLYHTLEFQHLEATARANLTRLATE